MGRRLVDAEDFRKFLWTLTMAGAPYDGVIELLDRQPIAFDLDKVMEQLKELKESKTIGTCKIMIKEAMEIVERRGINDEKGTV